MQGARYEKDVSTEQDQPKENPWFQGPFQDKERSGDFEAAPKQGAQAAGSLTSHKAGLPGVIPASMARENAL